MTLYVNSLCEGPGSLQVGDQIGRRTYITDENDVPTDPGTFEFEVRLPDHTVVSADITHEAVGQFLALLPTFTQAGIHRWKAISTGFINQVEQGSFRVEAAAF